LKHRQKLEPWHVSNESHIIEAIEHSGWNR